MRKKPRKSLEDSLAQEFVYGGNANQPGNKKEQAASETAQVLPPKSSEPVEPPIEVAPSTPKPKESLLMTIFQTSPKEATIRFTVDLPESMHRKLSILAAKTGKKKAEIVRLLLEETLKDVNE